MSSDGEKTYVIERYEIEMFYEQAQYVTKNVLNRRLTRPAIRIRNRSIFNRQTRSLGGHWVEHATSSWAAANRQSTASFRQKKKIEVKRIHYGCSCGVILGFKVPEQE
jgi:hypothetical protein